MFGDPEYYQRQLAPGIIELAKFEGTKAPTAVYELTLVRGKWKCDCPAARRGLACKHLNMIKDPNA